MLRLLVVDDEAIIADGMCEVLQQDPELDLDIYKAYSGDAAVRLFDRTRFDIVLTDIRMPGMDGLQLLEKIRERWPKCRVIFLTGHPEFNYVYSAIQYDGVSYLLKTEGYDKVLRTVKQTVEEIETEWREETLLQEAREQTKVAMELLRKEFVGGILNEQISVREIDGRQLEELGIPLRVERPVLILLGRVDRSAEPAAYAEKTLRLYRIRLVAESYLASHATHVAFANDSRDLVWLIQPPRDRAAEGPEGERDGWEKLLTYLRGTLELVQSACRESFGAELSFVLDDSPVDWTGAAERYAELNMLMNYRIGQASGMLLLDRQALGRELREEGAKREPRIRASKLELLAEHLEHGRQAEFFRTLEEAAGGLRELDTMHHAPAQEWYYSVALVYLSYMNRWRLVERTAAGIGLHKLMQPGEHESWPEAIAYLKRVGESLFRLQNQEEERRANSVVATIQQHIQDHLHDPDEISLVRLAELAYFNPSYLSRLFKQVTGENLSEFVASARMAKAKRLLGNPDLKIQEVAERVGYGTATNFTRSFRRATTMTPQEYRASLLNK